jgi:hypothetical protein
VQPGPDWRPGKGLLHGKQGRLPKFLAEDYAKFYELMVKDIEALEERHYIEKQERPIDAMAYLKRLDGAGNQ